MPFIGKDSRGPGNFWVRTSSGWQKVSMLRENLNRHIKRIARERISTNNKPPLNQNVNNEGASTSRQVLSLKEVKSRQNKLNKIKYGERPEAHYIFIPSTLINHGYLTVGEVLCKLDFVTALSDTRRFNYVIKFMELIVEQQFRSLSGSALKYLFFVLEEAVNIAMSTNQQISRIKALLEKTRDKIILHRNVLVGSAVIHKCRLQLLATWLKEIEEHQLPQREDDGRPNLDTLPTECKVLLLRMLTDPADIERLGQTNSLFNKLSKDPLLWESLFNYHYPGDVVLKVFPHFQATKTTNWKEMMWKMKKRVERKEEYADMLKKCCHCYCFYWKDGGHPCSIDTPVERPTPGEEVRTAISVDVSPKELLALFPSPQ